jgi:hypothetical protein
MTAFVPGIRSDFNAEMEVIKREVPEINLGKRKVRDKFVENYIHVNK